MTPPALDKVAESDLDRGWRWLVERGLAQSSDWHSVRQDRETSLAVARLLAGVTTRTGASRGRRLALCGSPVPVRVQGVAWEGGRAVARQNAECVTWTRIRCRDRACVACGRERRDELRPRVAAQVLHAGTRGHLAFLTLTQRKREGESAGAAIDRVLGSWKQALRRSSLRASTGGLRALELVARRSGEEVVKPFRGPGGRSRVQVAGVHAHLHALVELPWATDRSTWAAELVHAWTRLSDAVPHAQDVQIASWSGDQVRDGAIAQRYAYEVGAYALDPVGLYELASRAPEYVQLVLAGLEGRRCLETWGRWRAELSLRPAASETPRAVTVGSVSLAACERAPGLRVRWGREEGVRAGDILRAIAEGPPGLAALRGCATAPTEAP